jgi:hypothetical protein
VLACITLAVSGVGFRAAVRYLNVYLDKKPVPLRSKFSNIPKTLGRWQVVGDAADARLAKEAVEELGTPDYLNRQYAIDGDWRNGTIDLHLAYYTGLIDAVPHVPDRCFVAAGHHQKTLPENIPLRIDRSKWKTAESGSYYTYSFEDEFTGKQVTVRMPNGTFELRTTEFEHKDRPEVRIIAGYFFIANNHVTPTPEGVKRLAFVKTEEYAYYCKVQFSAGGGRDLDIDRFVDQSSDLLEALLPELMRCLPDWSKVEAGEVESKTSDT